MWRALYDRVVRAAGHRHAPAWLVALAFSEACVFPIPPDVLLAPMTLAQPARGWRFALLATLGSVVGGLVGYMLGAIFIDAMTPWLQQFGYTVALVRAQDWFATYGVWAMLVAGFTPIPYKVFTIAAGAVGMALLPFVLSSAVARGLRFCLVAGLVIWLGPAFEQRALKYINGIGWFCLVVVVAAVVFIQLR